jgi:hypothetical protein
MNYKITKTFNIVICYNKIKFVKKRGNDKKFVELISVFASLLASVLTKDK